MSSDAVHIGWLDGIRGVAAAWVFLSHAQILSGLGYVPVLSWGGIAVDLFMMLSGFLMAHHYVLRQHAEPWGQPSTWGKFWLRRWFRIAPLYYLLLLIAMYFGPALGEFREAIAVVWSDTATRPDRYLDQSFHNALMHLSFVFGFIPDYAFKTPLPDWSIGLEMQFYLVFPFLMIFLKYFGPIRAGCLLVVLCIGFEWVFKDFFRSFEMPSFLLIKLYVFVVGVWVALSRNAKRSGGMMLPLVFSVAVCLVPFVRSGAIEDAGRVAMVIGFFYLMGDGSLPSFPVFDAVIDRARRVFSNKFSAFCGDASYGFYLIHLLFLIPIAGMLVEQPTYLNFPGFLRFSICVLLAGSLSMMSAWLLYRLIEKPAVRIGKGVLFSFGKAS